MVTLNHMLQAISRKVSRSYVPFEVWDVKPINHLLNMGMVVLCNL